MKTRLSGSSVIRTIYYQNQESFSLNLLLSNPGKKIPGKMVFKKFYWTHKNVTAIFASKHRRISLSENGFIVEFRVFIDYVTLTSKYSNFTRSKFYGIYALVVWGSVINLWKPKTRQQTLMDSFSVLQFGACRIVRWTSNIYLCVCSGINR